VNNNDEKIFEFPNVSMSGTLDYNAYDLNETAAGPLERTFNKSNTDLSKGLLNLAGIKSDSSFSTLSTEHSIDKSIFSKLDTGLDEDLLNISGISSLLTKSNPILGKGLKNSSGIKSSNVFNSNPLILGNVSREVPKPLILNDENSLPKKEKLPIIDGIREMNKATDEHEERPIKFLQAIEDAIHELEKPKNRQITDLERYIEQNKSSLDMSKRLEELSAANKALEEQIKGLKASNEYLEKQAFELADTNAKLSIQILQVERTTSEIIKESKKTRKIVGAAVILALIPIATGILRIIL
jgi:hypothetical protein